jgi:GNAT superfamily N-acetyltransferase
MIEIRAADADDWALVRDVRLRGLADAPTAFGSRLEQERERPERAWRERLGVEDGATFVALDGDRAVGLVRSLLDEDDRSRAEFLSMWVDPDVRGSGVADALIARVFAWAGERGVGTVELWVTETNARARRAYERSGFVPDGRRHPHPSFADLHEIGMEAAVAPRLGRDAGDRHGRRAPESSR